MCVFCCAKKKGPENGVCRASRPQQKLGIVALRIAQDTPGRDYRQHGDRRESEEPAQRANVSNLPGHAQENNDHQGVPPPLLLRLHYHRSSEWK